MATYTPQLTVEQARNQLFNVLNEILDCEENDRVLRQCYGIDIDNPVNAPLDKALAEYASALKRSSP